MKVNFFSQQYLLNISDLAQIPNPDKPRLHILRREGIIGRTQPIIIVGWNKK